MSRSTECARIGARGLGLALAAAVAALPRPVTAQEVHEAEVTYARDVAPIIQQKCQECHMPNSIGPFSLTNYDEVRRRGRMIREAVQDRVMPPWHVNRTVGIQHFKNDRGLTDEQIQTIVAWVDQGMPFGDEDDLPPPVEYPDAREWQFADQFGPPDLVVKSEPFTLEAVTQDKWFRPVVPTGLTEERWVRAIEIKPSYPDGRRIVHHALAFLIQQEQGVRGLASSAAGLGGLGGGGGLFMEWAVGKTGEIFPEDAGKLMLPGSQIMWEIHYHAVGEEVRDNQVELGVWFYPEGYVPEHRTVLNMFDAQGETPIDIPPGEVAVTQNYFVVQAPARFENFQPHMHMRGKAMKLEAIYPNGRKEVISLVDNFQWKWHNNYTYADGYQPLFPKGTTLVLTAWHDNTADNPNNPDPEQWIGYGDRTVDEMAHAWIDVTYMDQADFDKAVAEREALQRGRPAAP
ncbi:MAG TPA: cytochrome c [Longimicrobiales bacterium]|nr:cytochrome c [Longimicrobiales bacterium]